MNRTPARLSVGILLALTALVPLSGCQSQPAAAGNSGAGSGSSGDASPSASSSASLRAGLKDGTITISNGVTISHSDWSRLGYRWEWSTTPLFRGSGKIAFVSPMGDRVAVQAEDAWTAVVETSTGNTVWQVRNASPLTGFLSSDRIGSTLMSSSRPEIFLMDINTGNLIARQQAEVVLTTKPVLEGGYAIYGTPTGEVLCHRFGDSKGNPLPPPLDEGLKAWGYLLDGGIVADPVKIGSLAGIVTQKGEVFFVDIRTGTGRGRARISGGMETDPVTDGTHMFVASVDQSIYAFAPDRGSYLWRYRTESPITIQPTYHDGTLYCTIAKEGLVAFDVSQDAIIAGQLGRKIWSNPAIGGEVIAAQNGDLILWDGTAAKRIDEQNGDVIASTTLPKIKSLVAGEFADGDLFAVGVDGQLLKFSAR